MIRSQSGQIRHLNGKTTIRLCGTLTWNGCIQKGADVIHKVVELIESIQSSLVVIQESLVDLLCAPFLLSSDQFSILIDLLSLRSCLFKFCLGCGRDVTLCCLRDGQLCFGLFWLDGGHFLVIKGLELRHGQGVVHVLRAHGLSLLE